MGIQVLKKCVRDITSELGEVSPAAAVAAAASIPSSPPSTVAGHVEVTPRLQFVEFAAEVKCLFIFI